MREEVRTALRSIAARFSDDAPSPDVYLTTLKKRYPTLDAWPADAELGLHVLAWALGPGFHLKAFRDAIERLVPDFDAAARAVTLGEGPSEIALAAIASQAFRNAAVVVAYDLNDGILYWPLELNVGG